MELEVDEVSVATKIVKNFSCFYDPEEAEPTLKSTFSEFPRTSIIEKEYSVPSFLQGKRT
jgi:hypothetical protein